jgi:hypothetical protein
VPPLSSDYLTNASHDASFREENEEKEIKKVIMCRNGSCHVMQAHDPTVNATNRLFGKGDDSHKGSRRV